jgi:hypothetical protein
MGFSLNLRVNWVVKTKPDLPYYGSFAGQNKSTPLPRTQSLERNKPETIAPLIQSDQPR